MFLTSSSLDGDARIWQRVSAPRQSHLPVLCFALLLYDQTPVLSVRGRTATLTQVLPEAVLKSFCKPIPNTMVVFGKAL